MLVKSSSPLGLYFHFPYCSKRCPYCDFTLTTKPIPQRIYLEATLAELHARIEELTRLGWKSKPLISLYFGGGTPSLWNTEELEQFIEAVRSMLGFTSEIEITMEANPDEIDFPLIQAWAALGINRVSLGVQSMREAALKTLGRSHTPAQVKKVVEWIKTAGIQRTSVDLIYGQAGEGVEEILFDLNQILALDIGHISLYELTIEDKTEFGVRTRRGEVLHATEERIIELDQAIRGCLEMNGYHLYEVSNACRVGEEAVHNSLYWTMGQYLGIGAGAHGRVDLPLDERSQATSLRWQNSTSPSRYLQAALAFSPPDLGSIEGERGLLDSDALDEERVLVGLRLARGVTLTSKLKQRYESHATALINTGLLGYSEPTPQAPHGRWFATVEGRQLLDHVSMKLILG